MRDVDVVLNERLIVRAIGEAASDEGYLVLDREFLPERVIRHRAAVTVRSRHEYDKTTQCGRVLRRPEAELGLIEIRTRRHRLLERARRRRRDLSGDGGDRQ